MTNPLTEQTAQVQVLKDLIPQLPEKNRDLARDLVKASNSGRVLSDKQSYWVIRLIDQALHTNEQQQVVKEVGDFTGVIALFNKAKAHLKYPKIHLQVGTQPLCLSVAGSASKAPGTVNVTDGRPFGQNTWFGRVTPQGQWEQASASTPEVEHFLKAFGKDPAGAAKECAILSGRCCFCNSKLTDEKSTAAGFGRTCAQHFGLEEQWKTAQSVLAEGDMT